MAAQSPRPTDSDGLTRRSLLRRGGTIAGGAAVTTTVGSRTVPQFAPVGRAQAFAPAVPIGILAGAAGVKYLTGKSVGEHAIDLVTGDDRDYSGYTGADALRQEIRIGMAEMQSADERVMTSIENNIDNSQNVALAKGKAAIIEEMNAENSESEAQTAMQNAIDDYYATIQENILNHWESQMSQWIHQFEQVQAHEDMTAVSEFGVWFEGDGWLEWDHNAIGGDGPYTNRETATVDLLNGESMDIQITSVNYSSDYQGEFVPSSDLSLGFPFSRIGFNDGEDGFVSGFEPERLHDAFESVITERDAANAELSGIVTDVYSQYDPGEIPTEDLVDPITASTELRQDYDNRAGQGAHAAMLGIPTTADFSALLHIYADDLEGEQEGEDYYDVWCDIFTNHVPTDEQGEEVGFETGQTYTPSEWDEPLYIAYNYVDSETGEERGDFTQIESEFTIELAEDADGNEVENFQTRNRNNQTSDVETLKEELEQLREEQIAMQEEAQEEDGGGGGIGDWFEGDSQGGMIIGALVVIGGVVGIGQLTG